MREKRKSDRRKGCRVDQQQQYAQYLRAFSASTFLAASFALRFLTRASAADINLNACKRVRMQEELPQTHNRTSEGERGPERSRAVLVEETPLHSPQLPLPCCCLFPAAVAATAASPAPSTWLFQLQSP
eukprot:GHVU01012070.1.p1 GENE.GHVU01012070.1~~GHVU01012070.1.p1  ORF type:complete len:129 (-),score=15.46 GHVU01012070.1:1517-1903(-)